MKMEWGGRPKKDTAKSIPELFRDRTMKLVERLLFF